ncbi:MAG TPA: hypothetical protein VGV37_20520 [Aliidongia sp.]|uniref:hypothetical protein n=1 Tax=Aliidongia sp. TaxID=1914230 RepID=UPI002DDD8A7D|nr:hypothetical protein [Aliidongia sp.]HEV2676924.1 hypothetical protein [Aliidongia sp.]
MPSAFARSLLLLVLLSIGLRAGASETGLQSAVVFTDDFPLASRAELVRRTLSPLNAVRAQQQAPAGQAIDLAHEKFTLYVPADAPPHGYALMVYVSPWPGSAVPDRWAPVLDQHGMIFVSAANAGNDANVLDRRAPLALLAAHNVMARYPVDPQQVFVGGFSGGSRVALRLALAYPDLFQGALLDAGSDPIGEALPPPPIDLFRRFQERARLVYLTGERDDFHIAEDRRSRTSMQDWCIFAIDAVTMPWTAHDQADPASLNGALDVLVQPARLDAQRLADCRAHLDAELAARFQQVENLMASHKADEAWPLLSRLDAQYGGLAAMRTIELVRKLGAGR